MSRAWLLPATLALAATPLWAGLTEVQKGFEEIAQRKDPALRAQRLKSVQEALTSGDADAKQDALLTLTRAGEVPFDRKPFLELAIKALSDESAAVRAAALSALPSLRPMDADRRAAARLVDDPSPVVRSRLAAALLVGVSPEPDQPPFAAEIEKLLSDDNKDVVLATMHALWGSPISPAAEARVIELSRQPTTGGPGALGYDAVYYVLSTRPVMSRAVAERLIDIMSDPGRQDLAGRACWGLSHHGVADDARPLVTRALLRELDNSLDGYVRENAIYGLAADRSPEVVKKLEAIAESSEEGDRIRAAAKRALRR